MLKPFYFVLGLVNDILLIILNMVTHPW